MIFHFFTNETASLTYNSNNNTPTAGLGTWKEACDQFYGVFEISQTRRNMESNNWAHFFLHTHSKGIEMNCIFWEEFSTFDRP